MIYDCDALLGQLSLQLDGLLTPEEELALEAELQQHPECRALFQAMKKVDNSMRVASFIPPPRDLSALVINRIEQSYDREKRLLGVTLVVGGAMSLWPTLMLLLGIVVALLSATNPGVLEGGFKIVLSVLTSVYALMLAVATIGEILAPWILPSLTLVFSVVLLGLTLVWAMRSSLLPRSTRSI